MIAVGAAQQIKEKLADHYWRGSAQARLFYEYSMNWRNDIYERVAWLDRSNPTRVDRTSLVDYLTAYNQKYNNDTEVHTALAHLRHPDTLVVIGGQQSGLLGGPAFVLYKAIRTIVAAKEASNLLGRKVIAMFWIAGEDHDWNEVNNASFPINGAPIKKISLQANVLLGTPVHNILVHPKQWDQVLQHISKTLPDTDFKKQLMYDLASICVQSQTLSTAFARVLSYLFGKYGLVLLDSGSADLRTIEQPVFAKMIRANDSLRKCYEQTAEDMARLGYSIPAEVGHNSTHLFYIHQGTRKLLLYRNGLFTDRKGEIQFTETALLNELHVYPSRFSNNVLTRPLMQDFLLPVLGTVVGHSELCYWGLMRRAFRSIGLRMPLLIGRGSYTVIDSYCAKYMKKYELTYQHVQEEYEQKRQQWLGARQGLNIDEHVQQMQHSIGSLYTSLFDQIKHIQPDIKKVSLKYEEKTKRHLDQLHKEIHRAIATKYEIDLRRWKHIADVVFPLKKTQDRVYHSLYFINKYGLDWIKQLIEIDHHLLTDHHMLYM